MIILPAAFVFEHPVVPSVKVTETVPSEIPVSNPALSTVAFVGSLLVHVPPELGDKLNVSPTHISAPVGKVIIALGFTIILPAALVFEHPVVPSVKVTETVPSEIPVSNPALSTVAIVGSLLFYVPPELGDKLNVSPTHISAPVGKVIIGLGFTIILPAAFVFEHPVVPSVKVTETVPSETPVSNPVLSTVAFVGSLLAHVPPELGDKLNVSPTHISAPVGKVIIGLGFTIILPAAFVFEHPVVPSVKVTETVPSEIPVSNPALSTVAFVGSLLAHVPPELGDKLNVSPTHISAPVGKVIIGLGFTIILPAAFVFEHPVVPSVKVTETVPSEIPVSNPALSTVAIVGSLLFHVPPELGDKLNVSPTHISAPVGKVIIGLGFTIILPAAFVFEHPVVPSIKVTETVPSEIPVSNPALSTVAIVGSLLAHVPPELGDKLNVSPTHISAPVGKVIIGLGFTIILRAAFVFEHPVVPSVKVTETVPPETPVSNPVLSTVAFVGSLLAHVPPELGDKLNVSPTHISAPVGKVIIGLGFTIILPAAFVFEHPVVPSVKVTETVPSETPVSKPALSTVAIKSSLLIHVPPDLGDKLNVSPTHISAPVGRVMLGLGFTVIVPEVAEFEQPVDVSV